jgi:Uma2 family endonuclease
MSTAATAVVSERVWTIEEYAARPPSGHPEELVRGRIVPLCQPTRRHGQICSEAVIILAEFVRPRDLGHVLSNDSAIVTHRDPDTVRGADVAYYSYARLPKGPVPANYGPEVPELVIEVLSPHDRLPRVLAKVAEYLDVGVLIVVVLDDERRAAHVFGVNGTIQLLNAEDDLVLPEVLEGFRCRVGRFFA